MGDTLRWHAHRSQYQEHVNVPKYAHGHWKAYFHAHGGHAKKHSQNALVAVGEPIRHLFKLIRDVAPTIVGRVLVVDIGEEEIVRVSDSHLTVEDIIEAQTHYGDD